MKPFFSIVIPVYNKERSVFKTLESALSQSFNDFEIIIIDDGSTDNSLEVINSIKNSKMTIYATKNHGVSAARNFGIMKSNGDYISFLDADDIWYSNHLENLKRLIDAFPNCGIYASAYEKKYNNKIIPSVYRNIPNEPWKGIIENYFDCSLINSIAWTSTVCVPKQIFDSIGYFDTDITLGAGEDIDMWIRIALKYPVAFSNEPTGIHNMFAENRLSNANTNKRTFLNLDKFEPLKTKHKSLKKYLDLNRFSIALQYKLAGNLKKSKEYIGKIDIDSLNNKQKILLMLPSSLLKAIKGFQTKLIKKGFYLSPFR